MTLLQSMLRTHDFGEGQWATARPIGHHPPGLSPHSSSPHSLSQVNGGGESLFRILAYSQSRATSQSTLGQQHRAVPSTMTSTTLMVAPTTRFPCPRIHGAKANQEASWAKALPTTTAYSLRTLPEMRTLREMRTRNAHPA